MIALPQWYMCYYSCYHIVESINSFPKTSFLHSKKKKKSQEELFVSLSTSIDDDDNKKAKKKKKSVKQMSKKVWGGSARLNSKSKCMVDLTER